jgi:thiol-disulfide isomerase/thioredoxin
LRRHHLAIVVVVAVALIGIALYAMRPEGVHETTTRPDSLAKLVAVDSPRRLPAAAFFDAKGARLSLASFNGHYVLLNLWATWCGPCVRELPALAKLQQAVPTLSIVAVSEGRENAAETERFLKAHRAGALHVYTDPDHAFLAALGVVGLPLSVLMDGKGMERAKAEGPAEWDDPEAIAYMRQMTERASGG